MTSTAALKQMFVTRVSEIAHRHGVRLQGWGDVFFVSPSEPLNPTTLKTKEVYTNAWMSRHQSLQRSHQLANAGYRVRHGWGCYNRITHVINKMSYLSRNYVGCLSEPSSAD